MTKNFRCWVAAAVGITAAFAFSSCAYDPYYSSVGGSYSSGYGEGYGYGGSSFSTSLFVSTGDPRWGYDPSCYSYYDYRSRRYYDPYLYGYYPIGYRPRVVYGVPHPHGWSPGRGYCPPPRTVRNVTVVNYHNRESAYRNSNYSWANRVHGQTSTHNRSQRQEPNRSNYSSPRTQDREASPAPSRRTSPHSNTNHSSRESSRSRQNLESIAAPNHNQIQRDNHNSRYSSRPAGAPSRQPDFNQQNPRSQRDSRRPSEPSSHSRSRNEGRPSPPANQRDADKKREEEPKSEPSGRRGMRSLGEG